MEGTIQYFMWGFQPHFRSSLEHSLNTALASIGLPIEGRVLLVGFLRDDEEGWPICIEPENGPLHPDLLGEVTVRSKKILRADPDQQIQHSDPDVDANYRRYLADRARRQAVGESIARELPGTVTFVGPSAIVAKYEVHTVVVLFIEDLQGIPKVSPHQRPGHPPYPDTLPHAVIDDALRRSSRSLAMPNPGADLNPLGASTEEVVRTAAELFANGIAERLDLIFGDLLPTMNAISLQRLEGEAAGGQLLLVNPRGTEAQVMVTLERPVPLQSHRAVRKLLQVAGSSKVALLTDGIDVYGLGEMPLGPKDEPYRIVVVGEGTWRLEHSTEALMEVSYGAPRLPASRLTKDAFVDTTSRIFRGENDLDVERLWKSAEAAMGASHGTLLVVSKDAKREAERLGDQALRFSPIVPTVAIQRGFADIDGAIMFSPDGTCHAAGTILDGKAGKHGDSARGARYNSAWRYVDASADREIPTLAIVISEDGMVDLIPHLRPRIDRRVVEDTVDAAERLSTSEPLDYESFYRSWRALKRVSFYLSQEQVQRANASVKRVEDRRWSDHNMRISERSLEVNPEMNDEYFI
jgi:hypothetical protein